ncbi:OLC1v1015736C1 [Oldenlandia corymbosa var. corymbosa]|uniref:OLC1v1015736C1 n=1 Tax=Oldenlandia corymbosa var. corymbosa TaxID=529605 RepID=A0AAV1E6W6_OLDCO|nr:OLC1v1015736C1 [Oldenlandia corymbosa var. corymbosa]
MDCLAVKNYVSFEWKYLLETSVYPREHELLKDLRAITATHHRYFLATEPDAGQVLAMLLEIIIAIDPDQSAYEKGLPIIRKSRVAHKINFINSMAHPVLDQLLQNPDEENSFNFAYVDADKVNYVKYHEKLLKLVKPGGLIVYDNTLWMGSVVMAEEEIKSEEIRGQVWMNAIIYELKPQFQHLELQGQSQDEVDLQGLGADQVVMDHVLEVG